jgi:hypothetical protein
MSTITIILVLLQTGLSMPADSAGGNGYMNQTDCESGSGQEMPELDLTKRMVLFNNWHYVVKETGDGNRMVYFSKIRDGEQGLGIPKLYNQNGRDNQALIIQDHAGNDVRFRQDGEKNRIMIIQSDTTGNGSSARVEQHGSGNRATIIQNSER